MQNVRHSMQNQILDIDSGFFYLKKKSSLQHFSINKMGKKSFLYIFNFYLFSCIEKTFIWNKATGYKKQTVAACTSVVVVYIMSITVYV